MTTLTYAAAVALRYSPITDPIDPWEADYATHIAADLARDNIPHAIVQLPNGCLQVWRKLGAQAPTEHRRSQDRPRTAGFQPAVPQASSLPPSPAAAGSVSSVPSVVPPTLAPHPADRRSAPLAPAPELLAQALRLAATRNAYAATQLRGFDTLVLATAAKEWDRLGFRAEFIRLINTELKRRRDLAAIGRSHLPTAA